MLACISVLLGEKALGKEASNSRLYIGEILECWRFCHNYSLSVTLSLLFVFFVPDKRLLRSFVNMLVIKGLSFLSLLSATLAS